MQPIKQYLEYRLFLHDFYEAKRGTDDFFSFRYMARKVGMDHGYLVKLLQQKVHIAEGHIVRFVEFCGLTGTDADYFKTLVHFNKSKNPEEVGHLFERLVALAGVEFHSVRKDQFEFYAAWHHTAIRALLGVMDFKGDYEALSKHLNPPLEPEKVAESIRLLERLNLILKDEEGVYRPTHSLITTGDGLEATAVRKFQREMIILAEESLARHPKGHRDISTVTICVDLADLAEIKDRISALRQSIMKLSAKSANTQAVFQLNVQLFPLNKLGKVP
jgi:uncharacterized protein (TIGR02147 family)